MVSPDIRTATVFDTKIALVLREDLAAWQKLNASAFLTSGLVGADPALVGEPYEDVAGNRYHALIVQPIVVLEASGERLATMRRRALERRVRCSLYVDEMFSTGHDAANRAAVRALAPQDMRIAGLALRAERKAADKILKGARMHG